jgi:hypothetical protein
MRFEFEATVTLKVEVLLLSTGVPSKAMAPIIKKLMAFSSRPIKNRSIETTL